MTVPAPLADVPPSGAGRAAGSGTPWLRPKLVAPWGEIIFVLAVVLGPFIYSSTHYALTHGPNHYLSLMLTNHKFLGLIATECCLLAALFGYLRWRGWTPTDFQIRINWKGSLESLAVAFGGNLANTFTVGLLLLLLVCWEPHPYGLGVAFAAQAPRIPSHSIDVSWFFILAGSGINAFLEELAFMGYGFNQFAAKRGPVFATAVMVVLRMLVHTYQGPIHMLGIGAFSVFFGLAYWYLRRLWPLILAHALIDIASFAALKMIYGR